VVTQTGTSGEIICGNPKGRKSNQNLPFAEPRNRLELGEPTGRLEPFSALCTVSMAYPAFILVSKTSYRDNIT
jgi:hypothetical protein